MTTSGEIVKQLQADTYALELSVPKEELEPKFNEYWGQVKDILHPDIIKKASKGGFRGVNRDRVVKIVGGQSEFFKPVLVDFVEEYLAKQERQALTFNEMSMLETPTKYIIKALVYLEPEVIWKGEVPGINVPLTVQLPKDSTTIVGRMVDAELAQAQSRSTVLIPFDGNEVAEGHTVVLDCDTTIDGKSWAAGSFTNNKWLVSKEYLNIPEFLDILVGMKIGESRATTVVLNDKLPEAVRGKTAFIVLRVNGIFTQNTPAIDDDLAKTNGFDTLELFKAAIQNKIVKTLDSNRKQLFEMSISAKLINKDVLEVEPVPYIWMISKAKEIYGQFRAMVRTEEELLNHFKNQFTTSGEEVVSKPTLIKYLAEQAAKSLVHDLVLRSWGKKKGIEGNTTLEALPEYINKVREVLNSEVVVEEYETAV